MASGALKWADRAADALAAVGGLAVVALVGVTFVTVVWRYLLGEPIYGIDDIAKMALALTVGCSIAYGARRGAHVQVDVLERLGGRRLTRYTDVVARCIGCATLVFATWALLRKGSCGLACGNNTADLSIPHLPFYMVLAAGFGLYALILLLELLHGMASWSAESDPNEH